MNDLNQCPFLCELRDLEIDGTSKVVGYICKGQCQGCQARLPAEKALKAGVERLKAGVERLKAVIAEIAAILATGAEFPEDDVFTMCKDAIGDKAILDCYNKKLRERVSEKGGESEP